MHTGISDWNQRYSAADGYLFGTAPNAFLASQAHFFSPGMKVLAVADGEGRNGVWLAQQGLDVLSVDGSSIGLEKARKLAEQREVSLKTECADLSHWDWGAKRFDAVVGIFFQFAGPALRHKLFQGAQAALKPGGVLLLEGYRPEQLKYKTGGPSAVENLYTETLLREEFSDMEILHLASYDAELSEGSRHTGMSALIDLVARKPGGGG